MRETEERIEVRVPVAVKARMVQRAHEAGLYLGDYLAKVYCEYEGLPPETAIVHRGLAGRKPKSKPTDGAHTESKRKRRN